MCPPSSCSKEEFAKDRACLIRSDKALTSPLAPADPRHGSGGERKSGSTTAASPARKPSTTHLVTADPLGNVVSYTLTIEQTGGSAITVPGRGFLLNNELTDFDFAPLTKGGTPDPNLPGPGKRPRSSNVSDDRPAGTASR